MLPLWKTDRILTLLKEAGAIALKYYDAPPTELKSDQSVVTCADREVETRLSMEFDRPESGIFMIGEETIAARSPEYLEAAFRGTCYIVDPIDGTAPYTAQVPLWGISIGLMENGILNEGAIYLPVQDDALISCRGTLWRARNLQTDTPEVTLFEATRMADTPAGAIGVSQSCTKNWHVRFPNQAFAWSSCVGNYYTMLRGKTLGYLQNSKLWDCAGGFPLLWAANFSIRTRSGREITRDVAREFDFSETSKRWRTNEALVIAPSPEIADHIWSQVDE